ncbi:MAG: hypothetical protein LPJ87_05180 [Zoogloeaceae bacterium]|nr:hypothetical protein [Zoogloeaceae bacterium]
MKYIDPLLAVLAAGIGLAAAHADGVALDPLKAVAALLLAAPAFMGFRRTVIRIAGDVANPVTEFIFTLLLPALFLLLLASGTDHFIRGAWSWSAFAAGLPFALLAACVPLMRGFAARADDIAAGRTTLAAAIAPINAKLWLFGLALPAYLWLVLQVGRDALPQACAAALLSLLFSLRAVRLLLEDFDDAVELAGATRFTALAAASHGVLLVAGFLLADRLPLF